MHEHTLFVSTTLLLRRPSPTSHSLDCTYAQEHTHNKRTTMRASDGLSPAAAAPVRRSGRRLVSAVTVVASAVLLAAALVEGQTISFCEGELGETDWACEDIAPVPAQVFDGIEEFLTLPGSTDSANPVTYKQIAGDPVAFDTTTGERISSGDGAAAVFVLTDGAYFCMLAESDGEAALFDAPEGNFVSSTTRFPTSTWLSEAIEAILSHDTKLKYIVYSHAHWDHIGAAGLVYDHFAQRDGSPPTIIASKRTRQKLSSKDKRDPNTVFGNSRGIVIPDKLEGRDYKYLAVGGLTFEIDKIHAHQAGDLVVHLDKGDSGNAAQGIASSILMVVDTVFPGWIPFYLLALTQDVGGYYDALEEINGYDFDVFVGGHLSRLGTKEDIQVKIDFYADVLAGAEAAVAAVSATDIVSGTGVFEAGNPNFGNSWLLFNELFTRQTDVCEAYVLDSSSRGRDWLTELGGVETTLRSQCWAVQEYISVG